MVIHRPRLDMSGPPDDERNTDASLIALTFQAAQLSVTAKECRVCATFLMRAIVTREEHDRIPVQPFAL